MRVMAPPPGRPTIAGEREGIRDARLTLLRGFDLWLRSHGVDERAAAEAAAGWGGDRVIALAKADNKRPEKAILGLRIKGGSLVIGAFLPARTHFACAQGKLTHASHKRDRAPVW